jgi:hypothetical protein
LLCQWVPNITEGMDTLDTIQQRFKDEVVQAKLDHLARLEELWRRRDEEMLVVKRRDDPRRSRTPRLSSVPDDHLVHAVRYALLHPPCDARYVKKLLESASARNNEEAIWVLGILNERSHLSMWPQVGDFVGVEDEDDAYEACREGGLLWLANLMANRPEPRAQYYRARALLVLDETNVEGLDLLRQLYESGYTPAISSYAWSCRQGQDDMCPLLRKAVEFGDSEACLFLGKKVKSEAIAIFTRGAEMGNVECMDLLVVEQKHIATVSLANIFWDASRCCFGYLGSYGHVSRYLESCLELLDKGREDLETFQAVFVAGRVFADTDEYWPDHENIELQDHYPTNFACVNVYLTVTHCARRAALQILALADHGINKDVALVIAKRVYESRLSDGISWYPRKKRNIKRRKK